MQDKSSTPRQDWDEQFVDAGWAKMRALLDEELPVEEERKRRFAFWWLWLGALLIGGGLTAWLIFADKAQPTATPEEPIATVEQPQSSSNNKTNDPETAMSNAPSALHPATSKTTTAENENNSSSAFAKKASPSPNTSDDTANFSKTNPQQLTTNNQQPTTINQQLTTIPQQQKIAHEQSNSTDHQQSLTPTESEVIERTTYDKLPALIASDVEFLQWQKTTALPLSVDVKKWQWHMSVLAAVQSESVTQLDDQAAGILFQLQRKTAKLALETGILYTHFSKNQSSNDEFSLLNDPTHDREDMGGGVGPEFVDPASYSNTNPAFLQTSITDLNYLTVPVAVHWRAARRFYIHGGLTFSYLLSGTTYELGNPLDSQLGLVSTELRQASLNAVADDLDIPLQRSDWSGQLGISYYPWNRLGLQLSYSYGFNSYIETSDADLKSYNRFWQFGLRYRIK